MRRVLKVRRAIPSEGGVPVTAWGGGTEPIARGDQIGQIGQRRQRGSGGRIRQTEAEAAAESGRRKRPKGQVAESRRQRNVKYVRKRVK